MQTCCRGKLKFPQMEVSFKKFVTGYLLMAIRASEGTPTQSSYSGEEHRNKENILGY